MARGLPLLPEVQSVSSPSIDRVTQLEVDERRLAAGQVRGQSLQLPEMDMELELEPQLKPVLPATSSKSAKESLPFPSVQSLVGKDAVHGMAKLKFVKMGGLSQLSREVQSSVLPHKEAGSKEEAALMRKPLVFDSEEGPRFPESYRDITCLSTRTNMKYMNIGE